MKYEIIIVIALILCIFLIYRISISVKITHKIREVKNKVPKVLLEKKLKLKKKVDKFISKRDKLRSLSQEVGGLEVDYKKAQQDAENDQDPWDKDFEADNACMEEGEEVDTESGLEFDSTNYKAFIHKKKKGKGKKGKKMGTMTLDGAGEAKMSQVAKLNKMRKAKLDRGDENKGMGF